MFRTPALLRSALPTTSRVSTRSAAAAASRFQQTRQAHAISNPTLANIEKRWEAMPPQEQAELWMALRDRMSADWNELTLQEKKAGTFGLPPIRERGGCCDAHGVFGWINAGRSSLKDSYAGHAT
jgi:cytochrome c oxidase subunit 4